MSSNRVNAEIGDSLWLFCLARYRSETLRAQLEFLQDEYRADVCIVLSLAWMAAHGRALSLQQVYSLLTDTRSVRTAIIAPLRAARRAIKSHCLLDSAGMRLDEQLYDDAKSLELAAERAMLNQIGAWFARLVVGEINPLVFLQGGSTADHAALSKKSVAASIHHYLGDVLGVEIQLIERLLFELKASMAS